MDLRGLPVEQVCGGVQVNSKCNHILNEVIIEIIEDGRGVRVRKNSNVYTL